MASGSLRPAALEYAVQDLLSPDRQSDELVKRIGIPPRPATLVALQREIGQDDPDMRRVAQLVGGDVALTASLLRVVNSSLYSLQRPCATVEQAISMLGLRQVGVLVTDLMLRKVLRTDGPQLTRFWDVSGKRSMAMRALAAGLRGVEVDIAHSFGLFCDVGIALLMQRFAHYGQVLKDCNDDAVRSFTEVEQAALQTDHALIGALMAKTWGVSPDVCAAIRVHHDYTIFHRHDVAEPVVRLVAMGLLAEVAIQRFARLNTSSEWNKGGDHVAGALLLSDEDIEDWIERLLDVFATDAG
jgi:HD-like signal output (HDOD) protein